MIRIIRLLEYTYSDYQHAEFDMKLWNVPPAGAKTFGEKEISSAILTPTTVEPQND